MKATRLAMPVFISIVMISILSSVVSASPQVAPVTQLQEPPVGYYEFTLEFTNTADLDYVTFETDNYPPHLTNNGHMYWIQDHPDPDPPDREYFSVNMDQFWDKLGYCNPGATIPASYGGDLQVRVKFKTENQLPEARSQLLYYFHHGGDTIELANGHGQVVWDNAATYQAPLHTFSGVAGDSIDKFQFALQTYFDIQVNELVDSIEINVYYDGNGECGLIPPSENGGLPFPSSCTITSTAIITDGVGITSTITSTNYVQTNLVYNYSFETSEPGNFWHARGWLPTDGSQVTPYVPQYRDGSGTARSGSYAVSDGSDFELWNNQTTVHQSGTYLVGMYAKCLTGNCNDVSIDVDALNVTTTSNLTTTYQVYSDMVSIGGGTPYIILDFNDSQDVRVDDVFVYPVDELGNLRCEAEYYGIEEVDASDADPVPDETPIPAPIGGGAGITCYTCPRPSSLIQVGNWIAYLACIIKNLFSCSLRVWLYNVVNVVMGVLWNIQNFMTWLSGAWQVMLNWLVAILNTGWQYVGAWTSELFASFVSIPYTLLNNLLDSEVVQSLYGSFYWVRSLFTVVSIAIGAVIAMIGNLYDAVLEFVTVLIDVFAALKNALGESSHQISIVTDEGTTTTILPAEIYEEGPNTTKVLWVFLMAISGVDYIIGLYSPYLPAILTIAVGVLTIGVILWTLNKWRDILPI